MKNICNLCAKFFFGYREKFVSFQLSGYSYLSTIWRLLAAFIPFVIFSLLLAFAVIVIIGFSIDLFS